ncbi:DUF1643 domain-containing protein [Archangium violaceum]|uniref:DUF1643 domain-containing protein n=1 Tax=Archangium violaceum TaxID=83451 RepID=UPI0037C0AF46
MPARRPYRIIEKKVADAAGQPSAKARLYTGAWPLDWAGFEANLSSGAVCGRHWPRNLPDRLPEEQAPETRPLCRHRLRYVWDLNKPLLGVISCNPSRATRRVLDETLHVTVNQAYLWGFGGIDQCNLSPVYKTDSHQVRITMKDLQDRGNWAAITCVLSNSAVWLAWGSRPRGCTDSCCDAWNTGEDCVLSMVWARQNADDEFTVLANQVLKGSGYRPPGHPSPRRFPRHKPQLLYEKPLFVRVATSTSATPSSAGCQEPSS